MGVLDKIVRKASEKTLARSQHEVAESAKAVQVPVIAALPPVRVLGVSAHDLTAELDLFLDETGGKRSIKTPINYPARAVLLAAMQDDPVLGIQTWKQEHREWFLT